MIHKVTIHYIADMEVDANSPEQAIHRALKKVTKDDLVPKDAVVVDAMGCSYEEDLDDDDGLH